MIRQYIVMALLSMLSVAQTNSDQSSPIILAQILNHLRNIDQDLTNIKVSVTENGRRLDTRELNS